MEERGFVLVGVVMFILVLTILGLSLFSLTNYEAQFMQQSMDRAESFQAAAGGLDRARFAIAKTEHLESVTANLPLDGVVYAVARKGDNPADTTGFVNFGDPNTPNIMIRVKAVKNGEVHFLEAKFDPQRGPSLYKRLMSLSGDTGLQGGLTVIRDDPYSGDPDSTLNYKAVWLYGEVAQNASNNPDLIYPLGGDPPQSALPTLTIGNVPQPDAAGFLAAHIPGATLAPQGPHYAFDASALPNRVGFYYTPYVGGSWSLDEPNPNPSITVSGTVIWMFDNGVRFQRLIDVYGSSNDMLVMVAKKQSTDPDDPGAGIALLNSVVSHGVPIILVSDGGVLIESRDSPHGVVDDKKPSSIGCLSVFAAYAHVLGTDPNGIFNQQATHGMVLTRQPNDPANARIDQLSDLGDLPNTAAGLKGKLRFIANSWREVDETNPP